MANQFIKQEDYVILLVDDDKEKMFDDRDTLKDLSYKVYTATSGEEAVQILKTTHVDIMIIDYYMKGINGEETIMKVRSFNSEVIIILQTGFAQKQPALKMLKSLKIQGYYDKFEGHEKLLVWVLSATRACEQQRELKKMIQKVELAHKTLSEVRKDQSRMIEQVRLASLGQKMGSIFHDMANPLIAIEGNISFISEELLNVIGEIQDPEIPTCVVVEKAEKILEKCSSCNKRIGFMKDMRNTVVAHSKQEVVNRWEKFSVDDLLQTVKFLAEDDIKRYGVDIHIDNEVPPDIKMAGKQVSLVQVLNNLITNSSQAYNKKNGRVEIAITNDGNNVKFVVRDWAGGISPDIQGKLLSEMVTSKGNNGNGIGVYTSYLTVTDYFGGTMRFDSIAGDGTIFYITIPIAF